MITLLLCAIALAEEPDETVVVESKQNLAETRAVLDETIRSLDYLPGVHARGRTVYMPRQIWEPAVVLFDDGRVKVHGHAVTPYLLFPGPDGVMRLHGFWGSKGEVRGSRGEIVEALEGPLRAHHTAMQEVALAERMEEIADQLDAIVAGEASWPDRRAAIVAMWLDTADNDAGARVRARIERFVAEEVDEVAPFTADEIAAANARRGFVDEWGASGAADALQEVLMEHRQLGDADPGVEGDAP